MPKITVKGQITIPKEIRKKFGFLPGMDVDVVAERNKVVLVKDRHENKFMKWLGRGAYQNRQSVDSIIDQLRGKIDE